MYPPIGHAGIVRELEALAALDDPPHALLLVGPDGTGRTRLATHYALLLNCERAHPAPAPASASLLDDAPADADTTGASTSIPCYECRPCRLISAQGHPDIVHLGPGDTLCRPRSGDSSHPAHPDSRDIRICQVRGLVDLSGRYPIEARFRVIIIEPAERLGRDSAHALLKTLEEPPGHTAMLLVTSAPEAIIETVRSRCRRIDVPLVAREAIEQGLIAQGIEPALAGRSALEARGRPARAITFAAQPDLMDDRVRFLQRCKKVAAASGPERMKYAEDLADRWRRDRRAVTTELDAWESFWEDRLRLAAHGAAPREATAALQALRAVSTAREDLLMQVQARLALELMLLHFPRITLEEPSEELAPANV
jgi:DNA polymerase III subunit delta'